MTAGPAKISERKVKADGSLHEYSCDLVFLTTNLAIIAYRMSRGGVLPGIKVPVPPGSISFGFFWTDRPYNLYRMLRPDGSVIAHRIDAVADVEVSEDVVAYRDTVLDWWILNDQLIEEDAEELEELVALGVVPESDRILAEAARDAVTSSWREIIAEAVRLEGEVAASRHDRS